MIRTKTRNTVQEGETLDEEENDDEDLETAAAADGGDGVIGDGALLGYSGARASKVLLQLILALLLVALFQYQPRDSLLFWILKMSTMVPPIWTSLTLSLIHI